MFQQQAGDHGRPRKDPAVGQRSRPKPTGAWNWGARPAAHGCRSRSASPLRCSGSFTYNSLGCSSTRRPETQTHRWAVARARLEDSHGPAWGQRGREGFPGAGHGDPGPLDPEADVRRGGHGQGLQTWMLWGRETGMKVKLGSLMTSLGRRCPVSLGHLCPPWILPQPR